MNRLLRISLDIFITSVVPILGWFLLGVILNADLVNVFTLTYPIQFIMSALKAVFATGANISYYKDKNENAINAGIILGTLFGALIFGILVFNIEEYINFMNMNIYTYKTFAIYSTIQIYLQLILQLVLSKLYYKEENKKANKIAFNFNVINFSTLIIGAVITKNEQLTANISILFLLGYSLILLLKNVEKFTFKLNILNCIKYDSVEFFTRINFIVIYLFGLSNVFNFGQNYALAISFATLVTDMQWDIAAAIGVVAKVDITKQKFNYKEHLKYAYYLIFILVVSIIGMTLIFYSQYNPDLKVASIFIGIEIITLIMYPLYAIKTCYLQLEYSAVKTTIHKQIANILRTMMSFLPTAYCTIIGQLVSMVYQLSYTKVLWSVKEKSKNEKR